MPAASQVLHRRACFRPRWIHHRDQAEQGHAQFRLLRDGRTGFPGEGEHTETVSGHPLFDRADTFAIRRRQLDLPA